MSVVTNTEASPGGGRKATDGGRRGRARLGAGAGRRRGGGRAGGGGGGVAGQVEQRVGGGGATGDTEAGAGTGIGKHVPPGVGLAEERAANLVPVLLGVGERGDGVALIGAADGPASLGDPDLLAVGDGLGLGDGVVEEGLALVDAVGHGGLVVRVAVEAEPVDLVDHGGVGAVGPGIPGVDVTDGGAAQGSAGDGRLDLLDVVDQGVGVDTDTGLVLGTSDGVTVEILAADGDTDDQLGEGLAVGVDGGLEGGDLVVDVAAGGPETEQERGLRGNSSGNSLDGVVGGTALDHGVQTGTGEAGGADEVLGCLELGLEVGLVVVATVGLGGTIVETLVGSLDGGNGQSQSDGLLGEHFGCVS